jgi:hypothetical protein
MLGPRTSLSAMSALARNEKPQQHSSRIYKLERALNLSYLMCCRTCAGRHGTPAELLCWGPRDARGPSIWPLVPLEAPANAESTRSLMLTVPIAGAHCGRDARGPRGASRIGKSLQDTDVSLRVLGGCPLCQPEKDLFERFAPW